MMSAGECFHRMANPITRREWRWSRQKRRLIATAIGRRRAARTSQKRIPCSANASGAQKPRFARNANRNLALQVEGKMTPEEMRALYDYNAWANHRALDAACALTTAKFFQPMGSSFGSWRDTLPPIFGPCG